MTLVDYTDKAIMNIILDQALQLNPWLKRGENVHAPCSRVANGKIIVERDIPKPDNFIRCSNYQNIVLPHTPPTQNVSVGTVRLKMSDVAEFKLSGLQALNFKLTSGKYIHGYTAELQGRAWLETYKVGDLVSVAVTNPQTFEDVYVEVPLTQQMIDDAEITFRFALSDQ